MPNDGWLPPEQWLASLAKNIASAGALFTDPDERVLIVKPNYRDHRAALRAVPASTPCS